MSFKDMLLNGHKKIILNHLGGTMKKILICGLVLFYIGIVKAQSKIEEDISPAIMNAKKGIYWALTNIPSKKLKIDNELISEDKLYSRVKLEKGIGGIKIESTGYHETISVTITVYRSYDSLKKEGYIKKIEESEME